MDLLVARQLIAFGRLKPSPPKGQCHRPRSRKTTNRLRAIETSIRPHTDPGQSRVARQLIAFGRLKLRLIDATGKVVLVSQDN